MTALLRSVLSLALLALALYGLWEVRRWTTPAGQEAVSVRQRWYRSLGFLLLLLALGLWVRGTFLPPPHTPLAAAHALLYWMFIVFLCLPLLALALLDMRENIARALQERRRLRQEMFGGAERTGLLSQMNEDQPK